MSAGNAASYAAWRASVASYLFFPCVWRASKPTPRMQTCAARVYELKHAEHIVSYEESLRFPFPSKKWKALQRLFYLMC